MKDPETKEEIAAVRALKRLAKKWPDTLWLYSGGGSLCVMRCGPDGEHVLDGDSVDPSHIVAHISGIDNSGGDW